MQRYAIEPLNLLPKGQFVPLNSVTLPGLISAFINITLIVAALLFVFTLLTGGIKLILSGGSKERVEDARRQVVNAFIGVILVFSSWALINLLSEFFGIDLVNFEIPTL
jgi:hypothetical protein